MFREDPPLTASRPGRRRNKFTDIVRGLQDNPDEFWNITEDVVAQGADKDDEKYFAELARSIGAGTRAAFEPRGAFEGRHEGTQIWAMFISPEKRKVVQAEPASAAAASGDGDGDATG